MVLRKWNQQRMGVFNRLAHFPLFALLWPVASGLAWSVAPALGQIPPTSSSVAPSAAPIQANREFGTFELPLTVGGGMASSGMGRGSGLSPGIAGALRMGVHAWGQTQSTREGNYLRLRLSFDGTPYAQAPQGEHQGWDARGVFEIGRFLPDARPVQFAVLGGPEIAESRTTANGLFQSRSQLGLHLGAGLRLQNLRGLFVLVVPTLSVMRLQAQTAHDTFDVGSAWYGTVVEVTGGPFIGRIHARRSTDRPQNDRRASPVTAIAVEANVRIARALSTGIQADIAIWDDRDGTRHIVTGILYLNVHLLQELGIAILNPRN